jgi:RNA polymerase sigma-70 factor (ECF subfamily)
MRAEEASPAVAPPLDTTHATLRGLVERASNGDADAFREIFERFAERVFRYGYLRLGRSEEANDLVQDVFLSVWKALPSFTYEHEGSFPAWLFRIASRRLGDRVRQHVRHAAVPLEEAPEGHVEFEGLAVSRRVLADGLGRLPDKQREVVILRFVAGLPVRDIAVSMGKTQAAVTALQMRGLDRLRRYMRQNDEG